MRQLHQKWCQLNDDDSIKTYTSYILFCCHKYTFVPPNKSPFSINFFKWGFFQLVVQQIVIASFFDTRSRRFEAESQDVREKGATWKKGWCFLLMSWLVSINQPPFPSPNVCFVLWDFRVPDLWRNKGQTWGDVRSPFFGKRWWLVASIWEEQEAEAEDEIVPDPFNEDS